jgi:hypothetical protein
MHKLPLESILPDQQQPYFSSPLAIATLRMGGVCLLCLSELTFGYNDSYSIQSNPLMKLVHRRTLQGQVAALKLFAQADR